MRIAHLTIIFLLNCVLVSLISRAVRLQNPARSLLRNHQCRAVGVAAGDGFMSMATSFE